MAKRTATEIEELFKDAFEKQKGERAAGWKPEDSEQIALKLLNAQTDKAGKEVKLPPETLEKLKAAMLISSQRILPFVVDEMGKIGVVIDDVTKGLLAKLLDVQGFRQELVTEGILEKTPKGKQKKSITALLK